MDEELKQALTKLIDGATWKKDPSPVGMDYYDGRVGAWRFALVACPSVNQMMGTVTGGTTVLKLTDDLAELAYKKAKEKV